MKKFGIMVGLDKKDSFEGWFCKIDDKKNNIMISVIWGYSTHENSSHAFIQFQDSLEHKTTYVRYPISDMSWNDNPFVLKIGNNQLSQFGMVLVFKTENIYVQANLRFDSFLKIKSSLLKPDIMGWLSFFPNECNHSITSMKHTAEGNLKINAQSWAIDSADSYMEKDWGTGFPKQYVWVQANDWQDRSFAFSYASVPMLGKYKKGFFLVLIHEGKEYRFTSIEGSKMLEFKADDDSFRAVIKKGKNKFFVTAKQSNPVALASPDKGEMRTKIKESIDGIINIRFEISGKEIINISSKRASIDVHF